MTEQTKPLAETEQTKPLAETDSDKEVTAKRSAARAKGGQARSEGLAPGGGGASGTHGNGSGG